jgi:hypothetical protein
MKPLLLLVIMVVAAVICIAPVVAIPVADFTLEPSNGYYPLHVNFTDTSTGSPTGWSWLFGDENWSGVAWVEQNASAGWTARNYFGSVVLADGSILVVGGQDGGGYKNDTWRSTDKGVTWVEQNASSGWSARRVSTVVTVDSSIILMGGYDGDYNNDTWLSTDNGTTWSIVNASPGWSARAYGSSVGLSTGNIVLMGGEGGGGYLNDTWRSTDNGSTWTLQNTSSGWEARRHFSSGGLSDGSIVLVGGDGASYYNDTWGSWDNGSTWEQITPNAGWSGRFSHTSIVMQDDSIILMGGEGTSGNYNEVWRSTDNGAGATWISINTSNGWGARAGHTSVVLPDGSIVLMGGAVTGRMNDVWRFNPVSSTVQDPVHTYTATGIYWATLQAYNSGGKSQYSSHTDVYGNGGPGWNRQDILLTQGNALSLTFKDASNFTIIQNVTVLDNHGHNTSVTNGVYNYTYTDISIALIIRSDGYVSRTWEMNLYQDYTGDVLLEHSMVVSNVHQTTYFPHLVRIACANYLGSPIADMNVTAVVVESTSPYAWLTDIFGINSNETQIVNTSLAGTTDTEGAIAFMMVENLKYKIDFVKPGESINQTNYLYPKEGEYVYVFWSEVPPSLYGSVSLSFWNSTNLSNPLYMDLGIVYTDTGSTTDNLKFTVYYENDTVLFTRNASTPNSWNISYPVLVERGVAYIWGIRANNTRFDQQSVQSQIIRFGGSPTIPFSLCRPGDPVPCTWNQWAALGIIFVVALLFGRVTIKYASAIIVLLTLFFAYIQWLNYTPLLLSTIVFLGILFYYRYADQESDT